MNLFKKKDIFFIILIYSTAHIWILLNNGIFWDDWTIFNVNNQTIINTFIQAGYPLNGYFHVFLQSHGVILYRLLTFVTFLIAALCLNSVLKNIKSLDTFSRLFIVIVFMIFPVNTARIAMINIFYGVGYALFFIGFWITAEYVKTKKILLRVLAIFVLYASFFVNSLLVFYGLVILYLWISNDDFEITIKYAKNKFFQYFDFIVLPFLFWAIKMIYFVPFGYYEGYNKLTISTILNILKPHVIALTLFKSFIMVIYQTALVSVYIIIIIGILYILTRRFLKLDSNIWRNQCNYKGWIYLLSGLFIFYLGIFPYLAVGLIPGQENWASRHQLLVPLGSSLLIYAVICNRSINLKIFFSIVLVIAFLWVNFQNYIEYQLDWYKQLSIIENVKDNDKIILGKTFLIKDNTKQLNAKQRNYRFYEYTGLLKYTFGEQTRFATNEEGFKAITEYSRFFIDEYNLRNYSPTSPEYSIIINPGPGAIDKRNIISIFKLRYYETFDKQQFNKNIMLLLSLNIVDIR